MTKKRRTCRIIAVRPRPGDPARGIMRFGPLVVRCALGRSGVSAFKREGDGATPLASMRLRGVYVRARGNASSRSMLPLAKIRADDGWCDEPADRNYNRPVRLPYSASAETMLRNDELYDVVIVLDWNIRRRARGLGSAVFLHIAPPGHPPTEGCVAISPRDMARLLPHLSVKTVLRISR